MMAYLPHILCALLFIGRVADVGTTYLVTPNLLLEANPLARKFRWPFALLTIALCVVPYFNTAIAVALIPGSFLVSASNARGIWMARTIGEKAYAQFLLDLARKSKLSLALLSTTAPGLFTALAGGTILMFYQRPTLDWGYWLGLGVVFYGVADALYRSLFMMRLFRKANNT
jgi:hypothetical protein